MKRDDDGHWKTTVALPPGRYQYKFIVDGEWIADPAAQKSVPNEHGSVNSVVEVRA
jgi:1,4-alpha-glucan branching enzyme